MRCHPARWLWGLIPVAMLTWLAVQAEVGTIQEDLDRRSAAALAAAGHDWASIVFDGRDGLLVGQAASTRQREDAADLVRGIWGVRVVRTLGAGPTTIIADLPIEPVPDAAAGELDTSTDAVPEAAREIEPAIASTLHTAHVVATVAAPTVSVEVRDVDAGTVPQTVGAASLQPLQPHQATLAAQALSPPSETVPTVDSPAADAQHAAEAGEAAPAAPPKPDGAEEAKAATEAETPTSPMLAASASPDPAAAAAAPAKSVPALEQPHIAAPEVTAAAPTIPPRKAAPAPPDTRAGTQADTHTDTHRPPPPPMRKPAVDTVPAVALAAALPPAMPTPKPPAPKPPTMADVRQEETRGVDAQSGDVPLPEPRPRRFETAALPPGNIAPTTACLDDVQGAARQVEVHFAHDDARLDKHGKALIDGLVSTLNACPGAVLNIGGHADASGRSRYNRALSQRRARGVAAYMAQKGIDAERLVAIGYGDGRPVAPNDTRENRARNRRIELTVSARAAPLPPMPVRKQGTRNGLSHR